MDNTDIERTCRNCNNVYIGYYCNQCGQKRIDRFTARYLWQGLSDDIFGIDKGLPYTIKELFINPGRVALDYIAGSTKKYYSPLKYLIFWTAAFILLYPLINKQDSTEITSLIFNTHQPLSAESFTDLLLLYIQSLTRHLNILFLALVPFLSFASYFFYRYQKRNMTELVILYTFLAGQIALIIVIGLLLFPILGRATFVLSFIAYYIYFKAHKQFFAETWPRTIFKSLGVYLIGSYLLFGFAFLMMGLLKFFEK